MNHRYWEQNEEDKEPLHWTKVQGNELVYPTVKMLWLPPATLPVKTRLKREWKRDPKRVLYVSYDTEFIEWRLLDVLREFTKSDAPRLRGVFNRVIDKLPNNRYE